MKALVVFHDNGLHILARWLKPGFKHVFVVLRDGDYWIVVDGRVGVPGVEVFAPGDYDLAAYYRAEGCTVIETYQRQTVLRSPFAVANCVGLTKAVLCLRSAALTPWQLYKYLERTNP